MAKSTGWGRPSPSGRDADAIRQLARRVADELENRGYMVDIHNVRSVLEAEGNLLCKVCSNPVAVEDDRCSKCGSKQAVDADEVFWKCEDCNMPISDPKTPKCPKCRGTKVQRIQRAGAEPYECIRCGTGIASLDQPSCPSCGETRAVKRTHGHPSQTVES